MTFTPTFDNYVSDVELQEIFRDKDTALPLIDGYILFYKDNDHTVGKEVYQLTGPYTNYTFIPYGFTNINNIWQVNLNSVGALDFALYYLPYDANGKIELYYIEVYNSQGVFQFSRSARPPGVGETGSLPIGTPVDINYVPNPQFLVQSQTPSPVTANVLNEVAPGGWRYFINAGSTSQDFIGFTAFGTYETTPPGNPAYSLEVNVTSPNPADTSKDLYLLFPNVYTFASVSETFTYSFWAKASSSISCQLFLVKSFGVGGSATTNTSLGTFTIGTSYSQQTFNFSFGTDVGTTVGGNGDDFVALVIRFPRNVAFVSNLTTFILTPGTIASPIFPDTTSYQMIAQSMGGTIQLPTETWTSQSFPNTTVAPNNFIGLPLVWTNGGIGYDTSVVSRIYSSVQPQANEPYGLLCDGASYDVNGKTSLMIPYGRLAAAIFSSVAGAYRWGTGATFVDVFQITYPEIIAYNNFGGPTTGFADGGVPTGFTFRQVIKTTSTTQAKGYVNGTGEFILYDTSPGVNTVPANGGGLTFTYSTIQNTALTRSVFFITTVSGGSIAGGQYMTFTTKVGGSFYLWFKVNGVGADPAPGGVGIEVDILSGYSADTVAKICSRAIEGAQAYSITAVSGASITAGSYFTFSTTAPYYVWYQVNGTGTDPNPGGTGIKVNVSSGASASTVADATLLAINTSVFFAVPDLRGVFLSGLDTAAKPIDINVANRFNHMYALMGANVGSFELNSVGVHDHSIGNTFSAAPTGTNVISVTGDGNLTDFDSTEWSSPTPQTVPFNMAVNYYIHL